MQLEAAVAKSELASIFALVLYLFGIVFLWIFSNIIFECFVFESINLCVLFTEFCIQLVSNHQWDHLRLLKVMVRSFRIIHCNGIKSKQDVPGRNFKGKLKNYSLPKWKELSADKEWQKQAQNYHRCKCPSSQLVRWGNFELLSQSPTYSLSSSPNQSVLNCNSSMSSAFYLSKFWNLFNRRVQMRSSNESQKVDILFRRDKTHCLTIMFLMAKL